MPRLIAKWTNRDFDVLDTAEHTKGFRRGNDVPWITKVDILEDIISQHLDDAKYYIIFDELDDDYRNIKEAENFDLYMNLITSLFKAVQDIRSTFKGSNRKIFPIVFLRDDIYSLITDADKNKWSDFKIDLNWDEDKIKRLIAFRISKAISPDNEILPFDTAWTLVFGTAQVEMGNRQSKRMPSFDYIMRSTQLRPRDFIRYIQVCAEETVDNNDYHVRPETVKRVDKAFSNYLSNEISDELFPMLPDISNIFRVISEIRKQTFSIEEFESVYSKYVKNGTIRETNVNLVLSLLYDFSVIGNSTRGEYHIFRYKNREARLNFNENVVVHRGLYKALQIL